VWVWGGFSEGRVGVTIRKSLRNQVIDINLRRNGKRSIGGKAFRLGGDLDGDWLVSNANRLWRLRKSRKGREWVVVPWEEKMGPGRSNRKRVGENPNKERGIRCC